MEIIKKIAIAVFFLAMAVMVMKAVTGGYERTYVVAASDGDIHYRYLTEKTVTVVYIKGKDVYVQEKNGEVHEVPVCLQERGSYEIGDSAVITMDGGKICSLE